MRKWPRADREQLLRQLETFADEPVERYWQLVGILNGQSPFTPAVPAFRWLIAALSADRPPTLPEFARWSSVLSEAAATCGHADVARSRLGGAGTVLDTLLQSLTDFAH
ncbi:MAG: hypothetical protein ACRDPY_35335 [Streptosporangiaceae bacterium]